MRKRIDEGLPVVRTSVNLSRLHIQVWDAVRRIHEIVRQFDIPAEFLEFELTETILIDQFDGAKELCDQLRERGYTTSIDDFGSGYAGINILQELNFDVLKLDRRFLAQEEPLHSRNRIILPDIIHMLKELQIDTICEGVETQEQCLYLTSIGCEKAQGYFFQSQCCRNDFTSNMTSWAAAFHGENDMMHGRKIGLRGCKKIYRRRAQAEI